MDSAIVGIIGIVGLLVLVFAGTSIAFSFCIAGSLGLLFLRGPEATLNILGIFPYQWGSYYVLICLPLFILMGQFAFYSGISNDLFVAANKWLGKFPGGLALATLVACACFAACTGSSPASAATMGTIAFPELNRLHYKKSLSTGCIAAGGTLGIIIPPSVILIVYGALTESSVGKLFIAGIFPGLMIAMMFMLTVVVLCKLNPRLAPRGNVCPWREKVASLRGIWAMLTLFILVIGGLYFGIFTPSEAGAMGAFGSLVILIIKRRLKKGVLISTLKETVRISCFIFTILIGAMIFNTFLVISGLPQMAVRWAVSLPFPPIMILICLLIMYIPLGCVMDCLPMILLTMPIVHPIIIHFGFDVIWFGILVTVLGEAALISPPIGLNIFIIQGITNVPMESIFRGAAPFLIALLFSIIILVIFPQITLFLPAMMK